MSQPEARLQRRIVTALRAAGFPAYRLRPMGLAGWPDLLVIGRCPSCDAPGHACFLEVKMPGGRVTRLQEVRLGELAAAGAVVGMVDGVEGALGTVRGD